MKVKLFSFIFLVFIALFSYLILLNVFNSIGTLEVFCPEVVIDSTRAFRDVEPKQERPWWSLFWD